IPYSNPQPDSVRARWRQLSAEHWSEAGRLCPGRVRARPDRSRSLDGSQRRHDLQVRSLSGSAFKLRKLYPDREHALHARPLLAGRVRCHQRIEGKSKSARLLKTNADVKFTQDEFQTKFTGLPEKAPDYPVTTMAIECDAEPTQDTDFVRKNKPRDGV